MFGNNLGTYIQKKKRAKYLIRKYLALFLYPDPVQAIEIIGK